MSNMSFLLGLLAASASLSAEAFAPSASVAVKPFSRLSPSSSSLSMAIDYNDPAVAEEFARVQTLDYDEVVEELLQSGVRAPANLGDMDVKLMLVEMRTVSGGGANGGASAYSGTPPATFSTPFEEKLWTKPYFAELYEGLKEKGDPNEMNVCTEYANEPENAKERYYKAYPKLIDDIDAALVRKPEITSPTVTFRGFPSNMGEAGAKMTLAALGEVVEFSCAESEDFPVLEGKVTFADIETAKKAIEQYDGMDMGMGEKLVMDSV